MPDNKCIDLAADAAKFLRDKRVGSNKVVACDAAANALTKIRDSLRDYLTGNRSLQPEALLQMCNAGLA